MIDWGMFLEGSVGVCLLGIINDCFMQETQKQMINSQSQGSRSITAHSQPVDKLTIRSYTYKASLFFDPMSFRPKDCFKLVHEEDDQRIKNYCIIPGLSPRGLSS